jgi:hypothetical protein
MCTCLQMCGGKHLGVKEGTGCEGTGCERIKVLGRVKHLCVNEGTGLYAEGSGAVYKKRGYPSPVRKSRLWVLLRTWSLKQMTINNRKTRFWVVARLQLRVVEHCSIEISFCGYLSPVRTTACSLPSRRYSVYVGKTTARARPAQT